MGWAGGGEGRRGSGRAVSAGNVWAAGTGGGGAAARDAVGGIRHLGPPPVAAGWVGQGQLLARIGAGLAVDTVCCDCARCGLWGGQGRGRGRGVSCASVAARKLARVCRLRSRRRIYLAT